MRPRRERHIGGRQDGRDGVAASDVPGEVDRQPGGLALQPRSHRSLPDYHEPCVHTRMTQRANGVDAPVRMFLHREAPAVHQQDLFTVCPPLPHEFGMPAGMKLIEIHTERHGQHVRRVNPVEFRTGECRRAHHGVVTRGGPAVREVCDGARNAIRKYLSDKTIQAFVRDHHRCDLMAPAPTAQ